MKKNSQSFIGFLVVLVSISFLFSGCSKEDKISEEEINTLACKLKPSEFNFGRDTHSIKYNAQDKPIELTAIIYNPTNPSEAAVVTVYTIGYNAMGKIDKVYKSVANEAEGYYILDYNTSSQLIKQTAYNSQDAVVSYTNAFYTSEGVLTKITTHNEGATTEVTTDYEYESGNLKKKTIENLYDTYSQEFYTAEFNYTYFDKENKIKPFFQGPAGLLFIADFSKSSALQFLPTDKNGQLFYAQETFLEKKMLKTIEIIAYRYNTSDLTTVTYSYDYDTDGFPTIQQGESKNTIKRYEPSPFGGSVLVETDHNYPFTSSINYRCQ